MCSTLYVQCCSQRDTIGIGGPWSEFVAYVVASIQSEETKLVFEGKSEDDGEYIIKVLVCNDYFETYLVDLYLFLLNAYIPRNALRSTSSYIPSGIHK